MFKRLKSDESGVILIMVLLTTITIMVVSIAIMTQGVSHVKSSQAQVEQIRAEQLALGTYAKVYSDLATGAAITSPLAVTIDNHTYDVEVSDAGAGPNGTTALSIVAPTTPSPQKDPTRLLYIIKISY